ncbi:HD domain-containing protein [Clostridium sporogenes]|uniref:HD domain-containing protein n=1 Tax=Clostridium sporogenes TaxID=1509 RepID=UPI0013D753BC|nr:HD domain-containing protein [Clostridium sporogenes]MBU5299574.1 HD domain-containing protein [Clostridium sporogenes]NFP91947.1 HD domain-containing protein [Clostridium sporogenes]
MNEDLLEKTLLYIKERFENDYSGHDYYHSIRVYRLATSICKEENGDLEIVQLASLLHDVDDYKLFGGNVGAYSNAETFLKDNKISDTKIKVICDIISSVSFKGTGTQVPQSKEGKIVQDADRLDAIGAIGIARTFAYGGSKDRVLHIPNEIPRDNMNFEEYSTSNGTTINHFYEKLLKLKYFMNTDTAKKIAESRHKYMEDFLTEFLNEWDGII